ncbi:tmRNA-binding protein SmpB [hydrothermal vent metagenome]|uniref:TmRNA-binding protein SmpB n=1 Tax=hydrothermal vent metagenome TaxID=652676 RepID=A0A3B1E6P0_9ZZZZ
MSPKKKPNQSPTIENRKARHDYEILDTLECGIALLGSEVKSVRNGKVSLAEGYVRAQAVPPALYLHSVNIAEYGPAGPVAHEPTRTRKLLAHTREIDKLLRQVDQKGVTLIPLKMYFVNGYAKVLIGLGKGRRAHDKRQAIAERENRRELDRAMSKRMR